MQELELTWSRLARIIWLIIWRAVVGSGVLGFICGGIAGAVVAVVETASGAPPETALAASQFAGSITGGLAGTVWTFVVVRMALKNGIAIFGWRWSPAIQNKAT